ncbi:MAG: peptidoglycan-binding domain-containing protein [Blastocatellia bacterium]|nr:peptidoglycan-binding domain-containing protein [Blastocatellia bacterium]
MDRLGPQLFADSRRALAAGIAASALAMILCLLAVPGFSMQTKPRVKPRKTTPTRTAAPPKPVWQVTPREIVAVQLGLIQRHYLAAGPSGKIDRETRRALQAYQADQRLPVTGEIDRATYQSFKLPYPATGREGAAYSGKKGYLAARPAPAPPPAAAAATTATTATTGGRKGTRAVADPAAAPASRGKGFSAVTGVVSGVTTRTTNALLLSREDEDVQAEVREIILKNPATQTWDFNVKQGMVTVKVPPRHSADLGQVIANIRQLAGVKSIFVIAM